MVQRVAFPEGFTAVALPLVFASPPPHGGTVWPLAVTVADAATGAAVINATVTVPSGSSAWTTLPVNAGGRGGQGAGPAPAGSYVVTVVQAPGGAGTVPEWVTDPLPAGPGGSTFVTFPAGADPSALALAAPLKPLGQQLAAMVAWQLALSLDAGGSGRYDVLTVRDPIYSGAAAAAVNSGGCPPPPMWKEQRKRDAAVELVRRSRCCQDGAAFAEQLACTPDCSTPLLFFNAPRFLLL
jgi:hypothetical protein